MIAASIVASAFTIVCACSSSSGDVQDCSGTVEIQTAPPSSSDDVDCTAKLGTSTEVKYAFDCPVGNCTQISGPQLSPQSSCVRAASEDVRIGRAITCTFSDADRQMIIETLGLAASDLECDFGTVCANGDHSLPQYCTLCASNPL